jgi:ActR/RegA family two-component response regulator
VQRHSPATVSALIVLEDSRVAELLRDYSVVRGCPVHVVSDFEEALGLARFQRFTSLVCDVSFDDAQCVAGLELARAAKHADPHTRTIVLATWRSPALDTAQHDGSVDLVLMKPQPLAELYAYALDEQRTPALPRTAR